MVDFMINPTSEFNKDEKNKKRGYSFSKDGRMQYQLLNKNPGVGIYKLPSAWDKYV